MYARKNRSVFRCTGVKTSTVWLCVAPACPERRETNRRACPDLSRVRGAPQGISADDAKKLSFRGPHLPEESAFSEILQVPTLLALRGARRIEGFVLLALSLEGGIEGSREGSFLRVGLAATSEIQAKSPARDGTNVAQGGSPGPTQPIKHQAPVRGDTLRCRQICVARTRSALVLPKRAYVGADQSLITR
jgi:hypothetical protein